MKHENWGDFLRDCVSIVDYIQRYESLTNIGGSRMARRTCNKSHQRRREMSKRQRR